MWSIVTMIRFYPRSVFQGYAGMQLWCIFKNKNMSNVLL